MCSDLARDVAKQLAERVEEWHAAPCLCARYYFAHLQWLSAIDQYVRELQRPQL